MGCRYIGFVGSIWEGKSLYILLEKFLFFSLLVRNVVLRVCKRLMIFLIFFVVLFEEDIGFVLDVWEWYFCEEIWDLGFILLLLWFRIKELLNRLLE